MLRVTCPCGAPYSLGDHLAGRSFKCPQCGRVLKVGAPSGTGPAPQAPAGRPPSGAGRPPSGAGRPSGTGSSSGYGWGTAQQGGGKPPAKQPSGGGLGFADEDEGLLNSMDNSREAKQPSAEQLRQSGSGRVKRKTSGRRPARSSGRNAARTSGVGRSSSSGRSRRASSREQAAAGPPSEGGAHSRNCPVCEAVIAKVAPECPSCGVVLKGPNAMQRLQGALDWSKLTGAVFPLAVIGAIGYGVYVYGGGGSDEPEPVVQRPTPRVSETPEPTPTPSETPAETPEPTPEVSKAPVDTAVIVPPGDHARAFEQLRDAVHPRDVHEAVKALAETEGVRPALEQALASSDPAYRLKVHLAALQNGDEDTRRVYIDASLEPRGGDTGLLLVHTVIAALDLDAPLYEDKLLGINRNEFALEWAGLMIRSELPNMHALETQRIQADPVTRQLLEIAYCYDRDGSYLESAVDALEYPSPAVRKVALKGIRELAGSLGPDSEEVGPWREWARRYAPVRELLGQACADYDQVALTGDGFAACRAGQRAAKQLCTQAGDLFEFLPVFYRDKVSESPRTGKLLGLLLAKVGAEHPAAAEALLGDLDRSHFPGRGGADLLRGAMLGLGTQVAEAVSKAVSRGAVSLVDDPYMFPLFVERADEDDVALFLEAVLAVDEQRQGLAWLSYSATRATPKHVEAFLRDSTVEARYEVGGRLGWEDFQDRLFDTLEDEKYWNPPLNRPDAVANFLGRIGTHALAEDFAKRARKHPNRLELYTAWQQLARPEDLKDLREILKDETLSKNVAERAFKAAATAGGAAAYPYLEKRTDEEDPHRHLARTVIRQLPVDDKDILRELRERLEGDQGPVAAGDPKLVAMLGRVGGEREQKQLWKACYEGLGANRYSYGSLSVLFVTLGRLGYDAEIVDGLHGYLYAGHRLTAFTAICFSLMFNRERDAEGEAKVAEKLAAAATTAAESLSEGELYALAALATIDRSQAAPLANAVAETLVKGKATNANALEPVAFALAASGEASEDALAQLCANPRLDFRQRVARGVALAALGNGLIPVRPKALQQLRYDRDEEVRGLAALALGRLGDRSIARELSQALALPKKILDKGLHPPNLARMVPLFEDLPLRALLWRAAETLLDVREDDRAVWHGQLGEGRIEEITRDLRKALLELN